MTGNDVANEMIFLSAPHLAGDEIELLREALDRNELAMGQCLADFEIEAARILDVPYTSAVASGTAAMHLVLHHLGVGHGDEVFASTLTFLGSVSPVTFLGARPVFVDSDRDTWCMDPDLLADALADRARLGKLPKAVIPTDLYGQCCNLSRIIEVCAQYNVDVVCDSAESLGATFCDPATPEKMLPAGSGAKAAIYSFNGNKIITSGGGGLIASADEKLIDHARKLANQAREPGLTYYQHTEVGYNYRMSNLAAAVGLAQLRVLPEHVERRRAIREQYMQLLGNLEGCEFMPEADYGWSNAWLTTILLPDPMAPDQLITALEAEGIQARRLWKPMHLQPVFEESETIGGGVSEDLFDRGICLPSGSALTDLQVERVAATVKTQWECSGA
jgi:dTDP-4-amino-4,6-dideoxygalactose transaminase